jgi:hypothetical protein
MKNLTFLFIILCFIARTQTAVSTLVHLESRIRENEPVVSNLNGFMFYDEAREQLILVMEFPDSVDLKNPSDEWLTDLDSTKFFFVGNLAKQEFVPLSNVKSKRIGVQGSVIMHGVQDEATTEVLMYQYRDENLAGNSAYSYDSYKLDFKITVLPVDHKVENGKFKLKEPIRIFVDSGRINQLKPENKNMVTDMRRD